MFTRLWVRIMLVILVVLVVSTGVFTGCGKKGTTTPIFSEIDGQILTQAYTDYDNLRKTLSPDEAREQLIQNLSSQKEVKEVHLGDDGYGIFISYEDGDRAIVDTYDLAEMPELTEQSSVLPEGNPASNLLVGDLTKYSSLTAQQVIFKYQAFQENSSFEEQVSGVSYAAAQDKICPTSKKVLILAPIGPEQYDTPEGTIGRKVTTVPTECANYLKAHGWTDSDITLKINTSWGTPGNMAVQPDDYMHISNYGLFLFFGHGYTDSYWSTNANSTEDDIYLQFCCLFQETIEKNPQYLEWKKEHKIVVSRELSTSKETWFSFFIRGDLLKQLLGELPSTYVQCATCYGSYLNTVFTDKGAKLFASWNYPIDYMQADSNQKNMLSLMIKNKLSAYDAFLDSTIRKMLFGKPVYLNEWWDDDDNLLPGATPYKYSHDTFFTLFPSDEAASSFYLPGWINLTVTGIPDGTTMITASILDENGKAIVDENGIEVVQAQDVSTGQTEVKVELMSNSCFPPGQYKIKITAYDLQQSNSHVIINEHDATILCGANNVTFKMEKVVTPFKVWVTATEDSSPAITSMPVGPNKVIYIWTQVESGETLDVTLVIKCPNNDPDDLTFKQTPGKPTMRLRMSGYYFENPGIMTIDAISPTGEKIGATTLSLN